MTNLVAYWHKSMDEIPRFYWEDLLSTNTNPFFCWDWLNALENSESVCPQTGWQPMHLSIWRNEFLSKWEDISKQGFDNTFKRMWNFYFSYCEAGFKSKNINLIQFTLQNK